VLALGLPLFFILLTVARRRKIARRQRIEEMDNFRREREQNLRYENYPGRKRWE
jgi:hypothetical protein